ncbi:MAG: gliding motility-associated C-terminal domain-containing protein [Sphingobacteriaceae bacterium]|nr:gliding motility-associated C-terminal domain-containing protein [Sphingobacteriaceae bacterium]
MFSMIFNKLRLKHNTFIICIAVFVLLQIKVKKVCGQSLSLPNTLNSSGGYSTVNGVLLDYSFGEMVLVDTYSSPSYLLSQGFLQPFYLIPAYYTDIKILNNVITPNGDGKNDIFAIEGLENYPENTIRIYDRAGRLIYSAKDYKNDWNGMLNGKQLFEDTYYYIISLDKNKTVVKGFVSIVLDQQQ